jgi:hypothetical protein
VKVFENEFTAGLLDFLGQTCPNEKNVIRKLPKIYHLFGMASQNMYTYTNLEFSAY